MLMELLLIMAMRINDEKNGQIFRYLLEKGAEVNSTPTASPLIEAVELNNLLFVRLLLEAGADVNQRRWSYYGGYETALDVAIGKRQPKIIQLLKEYGATEA